jgi:TonB family protein
VARTSPVPALPEEDEAGDVEVVSSRGRMDPQVIEEAIVPHALTLERCFSRNAGKRRWLGGHVTLQWQVDAAGAITAVQIPHSDLGSYQVESCLVTAAREVSFPAPVGGATDFSVPLEFVTRAPVEHWEPERAQEATAAHVERLSSCAAVDAPDAATITLYVGTRGKVQSVGFSSGDPGELSAAWAACAEKTILSWTLRDPRGRVAKLAFEYRR